MLYPNCRCKRHLSQVREFSKQLDVIAYTIPPRIFTTGQHFTKCLNDVT